MGRSTEKSRRHFHQAHARLPLGVSSNFRYWGEDKTIYISHGKGDRIWDIDGNEYIDYRLGYGPAILGYANEEVDAAARAGMDTGGVFALSTEMELQVAERICAMVPAAELVRFSVSGTEAVMAALRLARAYTGKDRYVMVEGGYHGVFSEALWYTEVEDWSEEEGDPELMPYSEGVPELYSHLIYSVQLNDTNRLQKLFERHADQIGAFLIEPMMGNCCSITADRDYMQEVRTLCDRHNVVLIIDEVKTGFRVARGGIQELMGIKADLCTFAKAMANGYPISALAGKEEIMRCIGNGVVHGGTYTAHSVSLAAANRTLEILDETDTLEKIEQYGTGLRNGLGEILDKHGVPHSFVGHPAMSGMFFSDEPPSNYRDWVNTDYTLYDALAPELHEEGVLVEPDSREPWFMCAANCADSLDRTLGGFEAALGRTLSMLGSRSQNTESKR